MEHRSVSLSPASRVGIFFHIANFPSVLKGVGKRELKNIFPEVQHFTIINPFFSSIGGYQVDSTMFFQNHSPSFVSFLHVFSRNPHP